MTPQEALLIKCYDSLKDGRAQHFSTARIVTIAKGSHWLHHDQFERFVAELQAFL